MKKSSHTSSDNSKFTDKKGDDPLSGYVIILTEPDTDTGEVSVCAYSMHKGLTYIGTPDPFES